MGVGNGSDGGIGLAPLAIDPIAQAAVADDFHAGGQINFSRGGIFIAVIGVGEERSGRKKGDCEFKVKFEHRMEGLFFNHVYERRECLTWAQNTRKTGRAERHRWENENEKE